MTDPGAICEPGTIDITGSYVDGLNLQGSVTYWQDSMTTIPVFDPTVISASGTYYIRKESTIGQCVDVEEVNVIIDSLPDLAAIDPMPVCQPSGVDITGNLIDNNNTTGTVTYWQDAGATAPLLDPTSILTNGTYYIQKVTVAGCVDITPIDVLVYTKPDIIVSDPPAECEPNTIDISTAFSDAQNLDGEVYYWQDATATIPVSNPFLMDSSGTFYIQKVTTIGLCNDIQPVNIIVNPTPDLTITDPTAICAPGPTDITSAFIDDNNISGAVTYWKDVDATIPVTDPTSINTGGKYYIRKESSVGACVDIAEITVSFYPIPEKPIIPDVEICEEDYVLLEITMPTGPYQFNWYNDDLDTSSVVHEGDKLDLGEVYSPVRYYIETVDTVTGCISAKEDVTVIVNPIPYAEYSVEVDLESDIIYHFTDLSSGGDIGLWQYGDGSGQLYMEGDMLTHQYPVTPKGETVTYESSLIIENEYGCKDTFAIPINVRPSFAFYVPKAFTPNGDNINDEFYGKGIGVDELKMWVWNRWGDMIFMTNDVNGRWDGYDHFYRIGKHFDTSDEMAKEDTYVYRIELLDIFGRKHEYTGEVNLIR